MYLGSFGVRGGNECIPCRALSSENSRATSSNLVPAWIFASASSFFENLSHCGDINNQKSFHLLKDKGKVTPPTKMCRTLIDCAAFNLLVLAEESSFVSFDFLFPPLFLGGPILGSAKAEIGSLCRFRDEAQEASKKVESVDDKRLTTWEPIANLNTPTMVKRCVSGLSQDG